MAERAIAVSDKRRRKTLMNRLRRYAVLYLLIVIPIAYLFVLRIYPILLQVVLSFKDYTLKQGIWGSRWVGVDNFTELFGSNSFQRILVNTLRISLLRLACGFFPPIILSIMLFDMTSKRFRSFSQSILYIPHFFSWVIVYAIVQVLFQNTGYINAIRVFFGGEPTDFLMDVDYFLPILIGSGIWKGLGWSTIIYLAALTGINIELFEVAKIDGAGPLQRVWYITIPGILPVIAFVLTMSLGSILSAAGSEQIILFYGPANYSVSDVIGTWVYRQGLGKLKYSLGSAVAMFESSVGLILVLLCNWIASRYAGVGIW